MLRCYANANPETLVQTLLQEDYWLTDEHIDHAQWLLSKQFPEFKGLHSIAQHQPIRYGNRVAIDAKTKRWFGLWSFALAVAASVLNGDDPSELIYDQSVMRGHLAICFHCDEMALFPVKPSKRDSKTILLTVLCV